MKKLEPDLKARIKKALADNPQVSQATMAIRFGVARATITGIKQEVEENV